MIANLTFYAEHKQGLHLILAAIKLSGNFGSLGQDMV